MPKRKNKVAKSKSVRRSKFSFNHLILVALAFALIGGLSTWAALAAPGGGKGGKPGGGGGGSSSSANILATPNPAAADGAKVNLEGCGYVFAPASVKVVHSAGYTESYKVGMWNTGCLDNAYITTKEAGIYNINVYQKTSTKKNATDQLKASTILTVQ